MIVGTSGPSTDIKLCINDSANKNNYIKLATNFKYVHRFLHNTIAEMFLVAVDVDITPSNSVILFLAWQVHTASCCTLVTVNVDETLSCPFQNTVARGLASLVQTMLMLSPLCTLIVLLMISMLLSLLDNFVMTGGSVIADFTIFNVITALTFKCNVNF